VERVTFDLVRCVRVCVCVWDVGCVCGQRRSQGYPASAAVLNGRHDATHT